MNIMCILESSDGGQQPPIQLVCESRQFVTVEFSGVGVAWQAHFIAESHSKEYNAYYRAMGQRLTAPDPEGA